MRPLPTPALAPPFATAQLQRSLGRLITFDQASCVVAVAVMLGVYATLCASPFLLLLAALVALAAGLMGLARPPLAAGHLQRAVIWVAAANWGVSLAAAAVATFCLPIAVVAALLPSVLAVPYVGPRALSCINVTSFCVSALAVVLATVQDFSGLTGDLPPWVPGAVLVAFVPFVTGLVLMVSAQNSTRLTGALGETLDANQRLRASEADLLESHARLAIAADVERRRIARDLHDGAQQRLLSLALGLRHARRLAGRGSGGAAALLDRLSGELQESMVELRHLAQGVYPAVLSDRGLGEALTEMAARAPAPCLVEIGPLPRCAPEVETSVYWCCAEALQNVTKHAGAGALARVRVAPGGGSTLVFDVEDDGAGFDPDQLEQGQGLANMADRIGAVGGQLTVSSAPGHGVRVHGVVPSVPAVPVPGTAARGSAAADLHPPALHPHVVGGLGDGGRPVHHRPVGQAEHALVPGAGDAPGGRVDVALLQRTAGVAAPAPDGGQLPVLAVEQDRRSVGLGPHGPAFG